MPYNKFAANLVFVFSECVIRRSYNFPCPDMYYVTSNKVCQVRSCNQIFDNLNNYREKRSAAKESGGYNVPPDPFVISV